MKVELKVVGGARAGQTIPVSVPQFMIGRASDCQLKPRSELISRYHCAILSEDAYVAVRDLGSKNGVYVNGERVVGERELKNGDRLMIGPLEFEVETSVALKGEMKPKVSSISEIVARAVEQNSINVATAKQTQAASQPESAQPVQSAAVQSESVAPVQPAAVQPETVPPAQPVAVETAPAPAAQSPSTAATSAPASTDDDDLADWLLGEGEDDSSEAMTMSMALEDLDLPYTPKEEEKPVEEKPQEPSGPSSSDAAAKLLKNFFKGG